MVYPFSFLVASLELRRVGTGLSFLNNSRQKNPQTETSQYTSKAKNEPDTTLRRRFPAPDKAGRQHWSPSPGESAAGG
jgi:hypothetical protein